MDFLPGMLPFFYMQQTYLYSWLDNTGFGDPNKTIPLRMLCNMQAAFWPTLSHDKSLNLTLKILFFSVSNGVCHTASHCENVVSFSLLMLHSYN